MKYDVSILVPIYNVEQFIERCLHSLFGQTYHNIQFVFIDDCSPDNSLEIIYKVLHEYPERKSDVKIVKHEKNRGLAAARNTGIENAGGEYVLHIDSDDYAEIDMVQQMILKAKEEGADVVVADYFLQWEKTSKYIHQEVSSNKEEYLGKLLDCSATPSVWNKLFRKDIYISNNITTCEGVNFGEDMNVTPKLVYHSEKVVKLNKAFVHYVQYNNNSYSKKITDKNIEDILSTLNHLECYFSDLPNSDRFEKQLQIGKLQKKLEFIKNIDSKRLNKILDIFGETTKKVDDRRFGIFDRLVLNLSISNIQLLRIVIFGYKKLFATAQFLKGR